MATSISKKDDAIPFILLPVEDPGLGGDGSSKEYRRNWARLIQKIYETDPLCCPKCQGLMKVISVIKQSEVMKKILKHLGLWPVESLQVEREVNPPEVWRVKARPPPKTGTPQPNVRIYKSESQFPPCENYLFHDPDLSA